MKSYFRNPFFYLSLLLIVFLGFQAGRVVYGAGWIGPSLPPAGGQPSVPIDTSDVDQTKDGNIGSGVTNVVKLQARAFALGGVIRIDLDPEVFFRRGTAVAGIKLAEDGKLKARHSTGGWFDIGSGGPPEPGGGVWTEGAQSSISYNAGNVGIGLSGGGTFLTVGARAAFLDETTFNNKTVFNAKVGIGTDDPVFGGLQIDISGVPGNRDRSKGLAITYGAGHTGRFWMDSTGVLHIQRGIDSAQGISIDKLGNFTAHKNLTVDNELCLGDDCINSWDDVGGGGGGGGGGGRDGAVVVAAPEVTRTGFFADSQCPNVRGVRAIGGQCAVALSGPCPQDAPLCKAVLVLVNHTATSWICDGAMLYYDPAGREGPTYTVTAQASCLADPSDEAVRQSITTVITKLDAGQGSSLSAGDMYNAIKSGEFWDGVWNRFPGVD